MKKILMSLMMTAAGPAFADEIYTLTIQQNIQLQETQEAGTYASFLVFTEERPGVPYSSQEFIQDFHLVPFCEVSVSANSSMLPAGQHTTTMVHSGSPDLWDSRWHRQFFVEHGQDVRIVVACKKKSEFWNLISPLSLNRINHALSGYVTIQR